LTQKAPYKGLGADSEEKREPASDIDTAEVDSLKVLDPEWPIREADIERRDKHVRFVPKADSCTAAKQHLHSTTSSAGAVRLLGANRGFVARLSGDGSYEGQRHFAFLLYRHRGRRRANCGTSMST